MLNDTSCRFFVETEILSWLCRSSLGDFDLLEILLHASELFENGMFLRLDTVESQVRLRDGQNVSLFNIRYDTYKTEVTRLNRQSERRALLCQEPEVSWWLRKARRPRVARGSPRGRRCYPRDARLVTVALLSPFRKSLTLRAIVEWLRSGGSFGVVEILMEGLQ
jgi:hypothetical protein